MLSRLYSARHQTVKIEYIIVTDKAVPGWADSKQRIFSNGETSRSRARAFAKSLGLSTDEYTIVREEVQS
jgi:hypothetical protein